MHHRSDYYDLPQQRIRVYTNLCRIPYLKRLSLIRLKRENHPHTSHSCGATHFSLCIKDTRGDQYSFWINLLPTVVL